MDAANTMSNGLNILDRRVARDAVANPRQEVIPVNFRILIIILRYPVPTLLYQALNGPTSSHLCQRDPVSTVSAFRDTAGTSEVLSFATALADMDCTSGALSTNPVEFVICVDEAEAGVIPGGFFGFVGTAQTRNGEIDPAELTDRFAMAHDLQERVILNSDGGLRRDDQIVQRIRLSVGSRLSC